MADTNAPTNYYYLKGNGWGFAAKVFLAVLPVALVQLGMFYTWKGSVTEQLLAIQSELNQIDKKLDRRRGVDVRLRQRINEVEKKLNSIVKGSEDG